MNENYTSKEDLLSSANGGDFKPLEDGAYASQVVAVVKKELKTQDSINTIYELVFELRDEEGETHYVRSKALKPSLHEKSNLCKMMGQWLKQTAPEAIIEALEKAGIIDDKGFNFFNFVGKFARITVASQPSKKNPAKSYPAIMGMAPAKVKYDLNSKSEIPSFFLEGLESKKLPDLRVKNVSTNNEQVPQNHLPQHGNNEPLPEPDDLPY